MDLPELYITQAELPTERDVVQCRSGKWVFVRYRMAPSNPVEASSKEEAWKTARVFTEGPVWEEHYDGLTMMDCIPPKEVWRDPQTCFLVTNGSSRPSTIPTPAPSESGVFLKGKKYELDPPETPDVTSTEVTSRGWTLVRRVVNDALGRRHRR